MRVAVEHARRGTAGDRFQRTVVAGRAPTPDWRWCDELGFVNRPFHKTCSSHTIRGVSNEQDEHNERLKRFAEQLAELELLNADAREESLVVASEMVQRAIRNHRMAVAASEQARADRSRARSNTAQPQMPKRVIGR
jgi:hypothetical protein